MHKPSQENFIKKEHKRLLKIHDADINAVGQWLDYINENSLGGVRMTAKLYEPVSLGFGGDMIADAKDLEPSGMEKVKELADKILASGFGQEKAEEPEQQNKPRSDRQTKTETEKESLQGTDSK